ncbi:MAG TPA: hypothetical protein VG984_02070 [Candidatus Paceibacterota bacterium]|nr:hypothetical protein [Candidatus Paceibacterota bacterium]
MKKITSIGLLFLAVAPFIASAQLSNVRTLIGAVGSIINMLIPLLVGVAILAFFWGLIKYISGGKGMKAGRNTMIAGIVSFFIMVSLYGIVNFAGSALGINQNGQGNAVRPNAPSIPTQ